MAELNIGFVIFPNLTQLDFTGPLQVFSRLPSAKIHVVAKSAEPVPSDCGLSFLPTTTFDECDTLDLICVPGGAGVAQAINDLPTVAFVRRQAKQAKYVTAVCTGAFVLGAAGLLKGRQATTHWAYTDLLTHFGATFKRGRVVRDANYFTAGGIMAGIDFALTIAEELSGPEAAKAIQLTIEYDPAPTFQCGHPDKAPAAIRERVSNGFEPFRAVLRGSIDRVLAQ